MKKTPQLMFFVVIAIVLLFLTGCGADVDQTITVYRNEAWKADISFSIPGETVAMIGDPAQLDAEMEQTVQEAEQMGVKASWDSRRDDTTLIYTIHAKGDSLETLKEIAFDSSAQLSVGEVEGKRQFFLSYPVSSDFLSANQYTLTLNGGDIVSSNGQEIKKGTVQWTNPSGRVEAVFTGQSKFSLGTLLLVLILLAGVGGGGWFFWQQKGTQATAVFCATCGQPMTPQAQFCPKCGQKR